MPTSIKQNWANDKSKKTDNKDNPEKEDSKKGDISKEVNDKKENEKIKGYKKMIAFVGTTYKMITAVTFPENPDANESPFFVPLLNLTHENYEDIDLVAGDAAYISRINCSAVGDVGAIPRIYQRRV